MALPCLTQHLLSLLLLLRMLKQANKILLQCTVHTSKSINPLNAELNPICHLPALLGAHHILHVSRIRVKLNLEVSHTKVSKDKCKYICVCIDICRGTWWHNLCMIFQITKAVPSWMNALQSRGKKSVGLSHDALLSSHCLGNTNKYKGFPKRFAAFSILHSKSTGNDCSFLCG